MKTKLIGQGVNRSLDVMINEWLDQNHVKVIDIKFGYQVMQGEAFDCLYALILYEEITT